MTNGKSVSGMQYESMKRGHGERRVESRKEVYYA